MVLLSLWVQIFLNMKKLLDFLTLLAILMLMCVRFSYSEPKHYLYQLDRNIDLYNLNDNFWDIDVTKQEAAFRELSTVPTISDIFENEVLVYNSGSDYRLYSKINDAIKYITFNMEDSTNTWTGGNTFAGNLLCESGCRIGADSTDNEIDDASQGSGSTTLYIGNAAIQVSSDKRLKTNIRDTKINALKMIDRFEVKDFKWNDPTDKAVNNRNSRGIWTGLIAQDVVEICPFVVNAPRLNGKDIDYDSDIKWQLEYQNMVPVLIKAVQEQTKIIEKLEKRIEILER